MNSRLGACSESGRPALRISRVADEGEVVRDADRATGLFYKIESSRQRLLIFLIEITDMFHPWVDTVGDSNFLPIGGPLWVDTVGDSNFLPIGAPPGVDTLGDGNFFPNGPLG